MGDVDRAWQADLNRYGGRKAFLSEQSLWAIWIYRFGRRVDAQSPGIKRRVRTKIYWVLYRLIETVTGISLPKEVDVGPGLRIWHFGGIFINPECKIGSGCTFRQGVTLGNRSEGGPSPVLGDGVDVGAYAQILGGIHLGNHCRIGAMAVVLHDVPADATAVGNPARILYPKSAEIAILKEAK